MYRGLGGLDWPAEATSAIRPLARLSPVPHPGCSLRRNGNITVLGSQLTLSPIALFALGRTVPQYCNDHLELPISPNPGQKQGQRSLHLEQTQSAPVWLRDATEEAGRETESLLCWPEGSRAWKPRVY